MALGIGNHTVCLLPAEHLQNLFWGPRARVGLIRIHALLLILGGDTLGLSRLSRLGLIVSIIVRILLIVLAVVGLGGVCCRGGRSCLYDAGLEGVLRAEGLRIGARGRRVVLEGVRDGLRFTRR